MPVQPSGWGEEFDRIARGGLPNSTNGRLEELRRWGGFTSFLSPAAVATGESAGIVPVAQVVGLCEGAIAAGYLRTTRPGQGRLRFGVARQRERTGPVLSWTQIRRRALARLTEQADRLGADAVVDVSPERLTRGEVAELAFGRVVFTGTAVRVTAWKRRPADRAVPTLASAGEVAVMLRAGIEPAGIAGAFAQVELTAGIATTRARRRRAPNAELAEVTSTVYEVRRLAMERLVADARDLHADGLLGVDLDVDGLDRLGADSHATMTVHVLASAVKRRSTPESGVASPVITMGGARV